MISTTDENSDVNCDKTLEPDSQLPVEKWSPKYQLRNELERKPTFKGETIKLNYALSKEKCLEKKALACDRVPVSLNVSSGNAIIEYSTLSFERIRQLLNTFYNNHKKYVYSFYLEEG